MFSRKMSKCQIECYIIGNVTPESVQDMAVAGNGDLDPYSQ